VGTCPREGGENKWAGEGGALPPEFLRFNAPLLVGGLRSGEDLRLQSAKCS